MITLFGNRQSFTKIFEIMYIWKIQKCRFNLTDILPSRAAWRAASGTYSCTFRRRRRAASLAPGSSLCTPQSKAELGPKLSWTRAFKVQWKEAKVMDYVFWNHSDLWLVGHNQNSFVKWHLYSILGPISQTFRVFLISICPIFFFIKETVLHFKKPSH